VISGKPDFRGASAHPAGSSSASPRNCASIFRRAGLVMRESAPSGPRISDLHVARDQIVDRLAGAGDRGT